MKSNSAILNRNTWRDSASKPRPKSVPNKKETDEYEKVFFDWVH